MNDLSGLNLGFFGTPDFSLQFLKYLYEKNAKILFVVSQPPSSSGRGKKIRFSPVHSWALKKNIDVYTPHSINDQELMKVIQTQKVDINVVVAFGKIINEKILNAPKFFSINVHASLLPRWRGAAPIQRAILAGDQITGVSIMKVEKKLDAGPVIEKKEIKIEKNDTSGTLYQKMTLSGKGLLKASLKKIIDNKAKMEFQDEKKVTYAEKIDKKETKINWSDSAESIDLKIRAFNPYPGAWTKLSKTQTRVKILDANVLDNCEELSNEEIHPGSVSESLIVKCGLKYLRINELQKQGKNRNSAKEFLNGIKSKMIFFE